MKQLTFLIMLISFVSNAQNYQKLLADRNYWSVVSCNFGCLTDNYFAIEDTIIGNYTYKFLDNYHYNKNMFLREDTIERKIYFRSRLGNKDFLLYDFSLNVGDSIEIQNPISPLPESSGTYILDSIIVRNILSGPRRYFYLSSVLGNDETVWVEGIGSLSLINTPAAGPDANYIGELKCFFQNISHIYEADSLINGPCDSTFISNTDVIEVNEPLFEIYPNPNNGIFNIKLNSSFLRLELKDFLGRTIMVKEIFNDDILSLETNNLKGLYFIILVNENIRSVKSVIIH